MSELTSDFDLDLEIPMESVKTNRFLDNVIIYISGFIMKKILDRENCTYCFTYLRESKQRVSCELINFRQLGGLVYPLFDIVTVVQIANMALTSALEKENLCNVLKLGKHLTNEIVAEILSSDCDLFNEIALHDNQHRLKLIKTIVFSFISLKGKHLCRTQNIESSTLIRHKNTKEVLFRHE